MKDPLGLLVPFSHHGAEQPAGAQGLSKLDPCAFDGGHARHELFSPDTGNNDFQVRTIDSGHASGIYGTSIVTRLQTSFAWSGQEAARARVPASSFK